MYKVVSNEPLNPTVFRMVVSAPAVAKKALAGQFVMLRVDEDSERIPLTVADYDREAGTVTVIFQAVGATTILLSHKKAGEYIADFAGPLGNHTEIEGIKKEDILYLSKHAEKEANPLYPVPKLMTRKELERLYYMIADWSKKDDK